MFFWLGTIDPSGAPRGTKKAAGHPHVWQDKVARPIAVHQSNTHTQNKRKSLGIQNISNQSCTVYVIGLRHEGAELEEDVCSHGIDPEDEGSEGVEDDVP